MRNAYIEATAPSAKALEDTAIAVTGFGGVVRIGTHDRIGNSIRIKNEIVLFHSVENTR